MSERVEGVRRWLRDSRDELVERLAEWVRIPSVAGLPSSQETLRRSAQWLERELRRAGCPDVTIVETDGVSTVLATWPGPPNAPRVVVYSHHDVRAVEPADWTVCPPFEPREVDGRLFGRGASDAKGQVLAHIWGVRALLADADELPVTLTLLVDGEEETGSTHLASLLDEHAERLAADVIVLSDTMTWSAERPAVCLGARGMAKAKLEIRGPAREVHSGAMSGVTPNPVSELARLLAALHDDHGRVTIPGFYDDVEEAPDEERAALASLAEDGDEWARRTGTRVVAGEPGRSIAERLYLRPSLEVLSIVAGDADPPTRGVIPPVATAEIQLSLVPDQHPDDLTDALRQWVEKQVADEFEAFLEVYDTISQPPYVTPRDHPALAMLAEAMTTAWQCEPAWMRNAGGGPSALLADALGAPVVLFGTGLPEDSWHGPDESAHIDTLLRGAMTAALWWQGIAASVSRPRSAQQRRA